MSYIRSTSIYKYVDEENPGDYIFESVGYDGGPSFVEDYGQCSNPTLVEFLAGVLEQLDDDLYAKYLLKQLGEKLNVKLRDKPVTDEEHWALIEEQTEKFKKGEQ